MRFCSRGLDYNPAPSRCVIHLAPQPWTARFSSWWRKTAAAASREARKGLNSLIILVAWELWKHRNACVFEKKRPSVQDVLRSVSMQGGLWCSAGASRLQELMSRSLFYLA